MNIEHLKNRRFADTRQQYDWRDSAYYALALGVGSDPLDEDELPFVYEARKQQVMPSQCVTLAWLPVWQHEKAAGLSWLRILHGEQSFQLHRPIPVEGRVRASHRIVAVEDKGAGRGALIHVDTELYDEDAEAPLASLQSVQFARDDGGAGSFGEARAPLAALDGFEPTNALALRTYAHSALLYRLASRDYMAIHADPVAARQAGFDRPISHGLNTLGLACRAVVKLECPGQPHRMASFAARFVSPGIPGDTVRIEVQRDKDLVRFRAKALERDVLLLDRGVCRIADV